MTTFPEGECCNAGRWAVAAFCGQEIAGAYQVCGLARRAETASAQLKVSGWANLINCFCARRLAPSISNRVMRKDNRRLPAPARNPSFATFRARAAGHHAGHMTNDPLIAVSKTPPAFASGNARKNMSCEKRRNIRLSRQHCIKRRRIPLLRHSI